MNKYDQDFKDFVSSTGHDSSERLDQFILGTVAKDINPSHMLVFLKLLTIQSFIGTLTLLFCPQFDISLTNRYDLFHFFHRTFGHYGCMVVCGSLFIGSGALFASAILSVSEVQKIKRSKFLHYVALTGFFVACFLFLGANIYLDATLFWLLGANLSGISIMQLSLYIKRTAL